MADLLIRDLDATTHEELKRRASAAGLSLQAYVTRILERSTASPLLEDWLRQLDAGHRHLDLSGSAVIEAARDELL